MVNLITQHRPNIILGGGSFFIDRYEENGGVRGIERYVGDTVAGTINATTERRTIFSGDGAVATKLLDKVVQIDRTIGITPQDATLDNMALFLIAAAASEQSAVASAAIERVVPVAGLSERDYIQIAATAAAPAGRPRLTRGDASVLTVTTGTSSTTQSTAFAIEGGNSPSNADRIDASDFSAGLIRLTSEGIAAIPSAATHIKFAITAVTQPAFDRVAVQSEVQQVRVALRYIEDADEGVLGRNIYIPRASVGPAGEAALKSRDTPQQFPLSLAIEDPGDGLAQMYVDGVPA